MKIYAISDLHIATTTNKPMEIFGGNWHNYLEKITESWKSKVTDEDVVLIAGDLSWAMQLEDAVSDLNLIAPLSGTKVLIRGNHDYWWKSVSKIRAELDPSFKVLQNDSIKMGNVIICGSRGWTCEGSADFSETDKKLYLREGERFRLALESATKIREDGDKLVVMIHYPPFNVRRENSIFTELFEKYKVNTVVYGHLHGKDCRADKFLFKNGIKYYLTSCDQVNHELVEIEV